MFNKSAVLIVMTFFCLESMYGQKENSTIPEVGRPSPEFQLTGVQYYKKKNLKVRDLRGKWVVVDFFSVGCSTCFESFPKIDRLQEKYKGKVDFILVGKDDKGIRPLYEKFKGRFNLNLPVAYDTLLFKRFKIHSVPHILWIDSSGIVQAITGSVEMTSENIEAFMSGKNLNYLSKGSDSMGKKYDYDLSIPLLVKGNGGPDSVFIQRSLLMQCTKDIPGAYYPFISSRFGNLVQFPAHNLAELYIQAYGDSCWHTPQYNQPSDYGKMYNQPLLLIQDSSLFKWNYNTYANVFCYSLVVPKAKASAYYMRKVMQSDLKNYFGYEVSIEKRIMPCWKITATKEAKIKLLTKGGNPRAPWNDYADFNIMNNPISMLVDQLWLFHNNEIPFIDETGISGNIDLHVDAFSTGDLEEIRNALQKNGLNLVKSEKEMDVVVIRDPK